MPPQRSTPGEKPTETEIATVPLLKLDPDEYRAYLADFDLTQDQQNELLEALWNILRTMVDIGFGLDSVQIFSLAKTESTSVDSRDSHKDSKTSPSFNQATESAE